MVYVNIEYICKNFGISVRRIGTFVPETMDRRLQIPATCWAEIKNSPTVTSHTEMAKKQNCMYFESDLKDGVLNESECLNIVPNEFHEI